MFSILFDELQSQMSIITIISYFKYVFLIIIGSSCWILIIIELLVQISFVKLTTKNYSFYYWYNMDPFTRVFLWNINNYIIFIWISVKIVFEFQQLLTHLFLVNLWTFQCINIENVHYLKWEYYTNFGYHVPMLNVI